MFGPPSLKYFLAVSFGALASCLMIGVESSNAIEELKVYRGVLVLEGKISAGDYDKFRAFLAVKSNFDKIIGGVFLASPGGNVAEAMRIGRLIRELKLSTEAPSGPPAGIPKFGESLIRENNLVDPKNYLCASACFFVYVSGVFRTLNWVGRLGVHEPIVQGNIGRPLNGDEVSKSNWFVRETVKNYLKDMSVPDKYADLVFSVPPNKMRWITQSEFDSDLQGFSPELRGWIGAKCDSRAGKEKNSFDNRSAPLEAGLTSEKEGVFSAPTIQTGGILKCWMRVKAELSTEAWQKVFLGK